MSGSRDRTRLGFGCAGLMQLASRRDRQRLLGEAFEHGIRHFDVARMYGLGAAEGELGRFARGRREQITIATKFGIEPSGPAGRLARFQGPARTAIGRFPALRAALKRHEGTFHITRQYEPKSARNSLKKSLEELGTEYVDLLFIHDPGATDLLAMDPLVDTLEELRRNGYIGAWGVSGEADPCLRIRDSRDVPVVLQLREDILDPRFPGIQSNSPVITFGVLSRALNRIVGYMEGDGERRSRWSKAVGQDCRKPEVIASLILQDALDRNTSGGVLFSTTRPDRVRIAMEAANSISPINAIAATSLHAFREHVRAEIVEVGRGSHV